MDLIPLITLGAFLVYLVVTNIEMNKLRKHIQSHCEDIANLEGDNKKHKLAIGYLLHVLTTEEEEENE